MRLENGGTKRKDNRVSQKKERTTKQRGNQQMQQMWWAESGQCDGYVGLRMKAGVGCLRADCPRPSMELLMKKKGALVRLLGLCTTTFARLSGHAATSP